MNELSPQHYSVTVKKRLNGLHCGVAKQYKQLPYKIEELQQLRNLFLQPDNVKRHYSQEVNGAGQLLQPAIAIVKV